MIMALATIAIIASIVPLAFKSDNIGFYIIDKVTVVVFIIDYLLRWIVSDLKLKKGAKSYLVCPHFLYQN